jgi:hypothetical protein
MKPPFFILTLMVLVAVVDAKECRWGLRADAVGGCQSVEMLAASRLVNARTICYSSDSAVHWNKNDKTFNAEYSLRLMRRAAQIAAEGYTLASACTRSDLIIKFDAEFDGASPFVSVIVTDGDSGDVVYTETRDVQDQSNDFYRLARHFSDAHSQAEEAVRQTQEINEAAAQATARAERAAQEQAAEANLRAVCQSEYDALKSGIITRNYRACDMNNCTTGIPPVDVIARHNTMCPNNIVDSERIIADEQSRLQQEEQEAGKKQREAAARNLRERVLSEWKQQVSTMQFSAPEEGWAQVYSQLISAGAYFYIAPAAGTDDCRFTQELKHRVQWEALNCLKTGRQFFFVMSLNDHIYLLKRQGKVPTQGQYASYINKREICIRDYSCYEVLAEVRQVPVTLPTVNVPSPESLSGVYENNSLRLHYPHNWKAESRTSTNQVDWGIAISPPEARVGSWQTHGIWVGYDPQDVNTLEEANQRARERFRSNFLDFDDGAKKTGTVGGRASISVPYAEISPISGTEVGHLTVVLAGRGFFWFLTFNPQTTHDLVVYDPLFASLLNSVEWIGKQE